MQDTRPGTRSTGGGGWDDLQATLEFAPLRAFGIESITLGTLLAAVLVVLVAMLASMMLQRGIRRIGVRHPGTSEATLYTVSRLAHYLLVVVAVLLAMSVAGLPLSQFAVFAGAAGVGLGFGLQAVFSNFICGLILLFDRSLRVGDFVELENDMRGVVRAINIRATLITTNDNIDVLVPNAEFVNGRVVNWTHGSLNRRIRIPFGVAYGADKLLVKKAALEAASRVPFTLATEGEKRPQVWLVEFGENSVDFLLVVWLTDEAARRNVGVRAAYLWELETALTENGIGIPFPQRDLHIRSLFGRSGDDALAALQGEPARRGDREDEPESPGLGRQERELLARNDARDDTERQIAQDTREAGERERPDPGPRAD
ncbi:mechanosensitive ion channel family protein [Luteimonas kalidii]|uniref:Mechanosensitive ion channel n=1 Tax=Luteimonas kalidii TaxID=3042025 RepID=A0ABT6JWT6_9GAMM|nr:mechanosensitive ion channel domain-containing protein [Luteimonas kalidii]MDH5835151.1 mechanosensitive ion channel [Luteimonas kalidii]